MPCERAIVMLDVNWKMFATQTNDSDPWHPLAHVTYFTSTSSRIREPLPESLLVRPYRRMAYL